jgi:hypothetical protein
MVLGNKINRNSNEHDYQNNQSQRTYFIIKKLPNHCLLTASKTIVYRETKVP